MVGAALLVQQHVPVGPAHGAVVEVVDHRGPVAFGVRPVLVARGVELLHRRLGQQHGLVGEGLGHGRDVAEHGVEAGPGLVPVEAQSPCVLGGFRVAQDHLRAVQHHVAVVVPHDDLLVGVAGGMHRRAEVVLEEVAFLLGRVQHRLPGLGGHRFVLHGDAPDRHAFLFVGLDEPDEVVRPCLPVLGQQRAAAQHVARGLHEGRRAPRAGEQWQLAARGRDGLLDHRQAGPPVVVDGERGQRLVAFLHVGVAGRAEVGTVDRGAGQ